MWGFKKLDHSRLCLWPTVLLSPQVAPKRPGILDVRSGSRSSPLMVRGQSSWTLDARQVQVVIAEDRLLLATVVAFGFKVAFIVARAPRSKRPPDGAPFLLGYASQRH